VIYSKGRVLIYKISLFNLSVGVSVVKVVVAVNHLVFSELL